MWTSCVSYFPGYEWRVASCSHCQAQVGWLFQKEGTSTGPRRATSKARARAAAQASSSKQKAR